MIRERRIEKAPEQDNKGFRLRGTQVSRVEGISDAVFGLAITLIIVSLKAPTTFQQLMTTLEGFVGSGASALIIVQIWNRHYLYFRRYALEDGITRSLNMLLLFLVIAYVYPIKFVFGAFFDAVFKFHVTDTVLQDSELPKLFVIYGAGFTLVYLVFGLMYWHALRLAASLELNEIEVLQTKWILWEHGWLASVGLLSVALALYSSNHFKGLAGFAYFLLPVILTIHGSKHGDAVKKLRAEIAARPV